MSEYSNLRVKPSNLVKSLGPAFPMFRLKDDRIELVMVLDRRSSYVRFVQEIYLPNDRVHREIKTAKIEDKNQSWHQTFEDAKDRMVRHHEERLASLRAEVKRMGRKMPSIKKMTINQIRKPRGME